MATAEQVQAWNRRYYEKTKDRFRECRALSRERMRKAARDWIITYLQTHPCIDCGEADPVVLEFDHTRDKAANICLMVTRGSALQTLAAEVEKCEVRCANCHRRKTARDRGYYRLMGQ